VGKVFFLPTSPELCRVGKVFFLPTSPETAGNKNTSPTLQKTKSIASAASVEFTEPTDGITNPKWLVTSDATTKTLGNLYEEAA